MYFNVNNMSLFLAVLETALTYIQSKVYSIQKNIPSKTYSIQSLEMKVNKFSGFVSSQKVMYQIYFVCCVWIWIKCIFLFCKTYQFHFMECWKINRATQTELLFFKVLLFQVVHLVAVVKGCGMGPWLVLVSSCFRENVVATCKIWSFLCSSDNLLQKNVSVSFFGNQITKWRSFENGAIFDLLFHIF